VGGFYLPRGVKRRERRRNGVFIIPKGKATPEKGDPQRGKQPHRGGL